MRDLSAALLVAIFAAGCAGRSSGVPDAGAGDGPDLAVPDGGHGPGPLGVPTTCKAPERPSGTTAITLVEAFPGLPQLNLPVGITPVPGDGDHFYLWQQSGQLRRFARDNPGDLETVLDLAQQQGKLATDGEAGLLGFTFSPLWPVSHDAYLSYNTPSGAGAGFDSVVARISSSDGGASWSADKSVLQFGQPYTNHNGGNIVFGPDGYLYAGFGDGGDQYDPQNRAQNLGVFFGKILRLDVEGRTTYAIPPDNPFAGDTTGKKKKEIFAYGFRNPWRFSFDRASGALFVGDVGQDRWEEVDLVQKGGNYGWRVIEGFHCPDGGDSCALAGALPPLVDYGHPNNTDDPEGGQSVTGGYVYHGTSVPSLVGSYVFADYVSGRIWRIVYDGDGVAARELLLSSGKNISSFGEGLDGELYVVSYGDGKIYKVAAGATTPPSPFPATLSASGCAPSAPGLIPYEVNAPLWSDGADKRRWLALPDGGRIHIGDGGHWELPVGTVLVKEFSLAQKRLETRLLVHHVDGDWAGYTYQWNDDQQDAVLLPAAKTVAAANGQSWYIPGRDDCLRCHTGAAGRTLGLETAQLNRAWPDGTGQQLTDLAAAGLFDAPLPGLLAALPAYDSNAPVDQRARAYLHANCSFCHRPSGPGRTPPDWRFGLSLADTGACGTTPGDGDLGVTGAKIITPGAPAASVTSLRMHTLDAPRMPPLASRRVDDQGTALVDAWIASLSACN